MAKRAKQATRRAGTRGSQRMGRPHRAFQTPDLFAELRQLVAQIPAGRVTTYGRLATALGDVSAARWVASYLLDPDGPVDLPLHRVVLRDGSPGKFHTGSTAEKARRLMAEGVCLAEAGVDLGRYEFDSFRCAAPLRRLQQQQERLLECLSVKSPPQSPEFVGGVDVSYRGKSNALPTQGTAAYALVHVESGELVWSHTIQQEVTFPYIPGYLAFRELPILLELLRQVQEADRLAEVVLVDGNGLLHQRRAGIATHLGILADVATIGIGKSLLCGSVAAGSPGEPRPVMHAGQLVAMAVQGGPHKPAVYVSCGHRVSLDFAVTTTLSLFRGKRVPEPIYHAHTLSRAQAKQIAAPRQQKRARAAGNSP